MATIGQDGTYDDGTNFTSGGNGVSSGGQNDDIWSSTGKYGNSPRFIPGSGWWAPGQGWVGSVTDKDAPAYAYKVASDQLAQGGANMNPNHADDAGDIGYYGNKAAAGGLYANGPSIDQTASGQSRDMSMGALGLLQGRAQGDITPAQQLQAQQTAGAVNAVQSGAASIKGGAQARAAAGMNAAGQTDRTLNSGNADQAALRAKEIADASSQFFGASSAQRGRDLGLATSQAQLDAAQRAQNEQWQENYKNLQFGQQKAITEDALGLSAEQQNATNAQRTTALTENQTSMNNAKTTAGMVTGGLNGAATAAGNTQSSQPQQTKSDDPWDPSNYSGSDPQMKTNVRPVDDKTADALARIAEGMKNGQKESLREGPSVGGSARDRVRARASDYDGKYLPAPKAPPPSLDDAITAQVARDRADIAAQPMYGYFSPDDAPRHPAGGWSLGEGFSDDPGHNYSSQARHVRPENTWAPGSADFYAGSHAKDLTTSDPAAKREAFVAGLQHANAAQDTGHFGELPDYMQPGASRQQPADTTARKAAVAQTAPRQDAYAQHVDNIHAQGRRDVNDAIREGGLVFGPGAYLGAGIADAEESGRQEKRMQTPPATLPERARQGLSDQLSRLYPERNVDLSQQEGEGGPAREPVSFERDTTTSDPETKTHFGNSPMADANRSFEPSSYEYKPEHLPSDQSPGEVNVGPMADRMKADPIAGTAIVTDPKTGLLAIDKTKGLKLALGGLSSLQRQVDRLEKR